MSAARGDKTFEAWADSRGMIGDVRHYARMGWQGKETVIPQTTTPDWAKLDKKLMEVLEPLVSDDKSIPTSVIRNLRALLRVAGGFQ